MYVDSFDYNTKPKRIKIEPIIRKRAPKPVPSQIKSTGNGIVEPPFTPQRIDSDKVRIKKVIWEE